MKQELNLESNQTSNDDVLLPVNITEDIVEDFARQLDEVVRIQDQEGTDEEEDEFDNFGYQQLPQDEDDDIMYEQLESDDEQEEHVNNPVDIELDPSERLDEETSDLIKSIMSDIKLSEQATPEWAKNLPERVWLPRIKKQE